MSVLQSLRTCQLHCHVAKLKQLFCCVRATVESRCDFELPVCVRRILFRAIPSFMCEPGGGGGGGGGARLAMTHSVVQCGWTQTHTVRTNHEQHEGDTYVLRSAVSCPNSSVGLTERVKPAFVGMLQHCGL